MSMNKIKIISDSTCDLSTDLLRQHDIDLVPLFVNFREDSYLDGVNLTVSEMYEKVKQKGFLPTTAAASPGSFETVFKKYLAEGYQILYLGIGAKFSSTLQSANLAKQVLGDPKAIHLIDSANLSSGSGLLLLKAAQFRDAGDDIETVVRKVQDLVPKVRTQFVINTMEYLYKGGRCNSLVALMGTILKIKPIIKVRDGLMTVGKKGHGKITSGIDILLEELRAALPDIDPDFLMVTHSLASESAKYIFEKIKEVPIAHKYDTPAGCVISSHCGQGCIGILYIMK